jgi:adenosine deaminase
MREEDAQLTALYITLNSDDIYLRYSGYTYSYYAIRNIYNYLSTAKKAEASKINA